MGEKNEYTRHVYARDDGWWALEISRGGEVLFSGKVLDEASAEKICASYLRRLRGQRGGRDEAGFNRLPTSKPREAP